VKGLELRPAATPENLYCRGLPGIATFSLPAGAFNIVSDLRDCRQKSRRL